MLFRSEMVKASRVCQYNALSKTYLLQFCKFLDKLDSSEDANLVSPLVYDNNPGLKEMVEWCRTHRTEWDDISNEGHESLAEDLCDNG